MVARRRLDNAITPGRKVRYLNGRLCGHVGLVDSDSFQVILDDGDSRWLTEDEVFTASPVSVVLAVDELGAESLPIHSIRPHKPQSLRSEW